MFYPVKVVRRAVFYSATLATLLFPALLSAAPISQGSFGVAGSFSWAPGSTLANADAMFMGNGGNFLITSPGTFDLAGAGAYGATTTLRDIPALSTFTPLNSFVTAAGGTSVNLRSFSVAFQNATFLNFFGEIDILSTGFDLTPGVMTGTATSINNSTAALALTFSARPAVPPLVNEEEELSPLEEEPPAEKEDSQPANEPARVPEPWTLALLGLGLTTLRVVRRRTSPDTQRRAR